jgi:amidase
VSIKDHILVKGTDTSTGYIAWAYNKVADKDAVVVRILREAGAVIYVKTANPQTLLVSYGLISPPHDPFAHIGIRLGPRNKQ